MADKHELVAGILDAFTRELSQALTTAGPEEVQLGWSLAADPRDSESWVWWSGAMSTDADASVFLGAPQETWDELSRGGATDSQETSSERVGQCFEKALQERFGDGVAVANTGPASAPPEGWTRISIEFHHGAGQWPSACCVLSPAFEAALGAALDADRATAPLPASNNRLNPAEMLLHVQVPVSVTFGGTQIRMKELLNLTAGSVVELDQSLHDKVEVRVNDRVIARGEVVAVDGHYGVRVLELVSGKPTEKGLSA